MINELVNPLIHTFFVLISLVVGVLIFKFIKYPERQNGIKVSSLIPVFVFGALLGAKIPVLISYGWQKNLVWTGKSYYGALIGAFVAINIYKLVFKIKGNFGDRFVIPLCVSACIGKIGCFFYGCCSGSTTDFIIKIKNHSGVYVHPVQLYEAFFEFFCFVFFSILYKLKLVAGSHFIIYIIIYMIFRFFIEFIRTEPEIALSFSIYQIMSLIFVPLFGLLLYRRILNER